MVDGEWYDQWFDTKSSGGRFIRSEAQFRNWITPDGSPGPSGAGGFKAEPGRYHLYIGHACPWAHRTVIFRALKTGLACRSCTGIWPRTVGTLPAAKA